MIQINCLHLTDMHLGMRGARDFWPTIERDFFNDIEYLTNNFGPLDLVLFTGDLVQRGAPNEYEEVDRLLEKFWSKFNHFGYDPKFLAVPGNHDLVRPREDEAALLALVSLWGKPVVQHAFWETPDSEYRQLVTKAFANYEEWWLGKTRKGIPARQRPSEFNPGFLPGDFSATVEKDGLKLGVVGLNSTFLQLQAGDMTGQLAVHARQFHAACGGHGPDWVDQHDVSVLLTHHPVDWLTKEAQEHLNGLIHHPPELFALHLFGHMHAARVTSNIEGGSARARRRLQGCSLFGMDSWEGSAAERLHGYSLVQLKVEGDTGTLQIFGRQALPKRDHGRQFDRDPDLTVRGQEGSDLLPVILNRSRAAKREAKAKTAPPPPEPVIVARAPTPPSSPPTNLLTATNEVPEKPVGRADDIDALRDLLSDARAGVRLVTLLGDGGVGKSTLALFVVAQMLAQRELHHFSSGVFHLDFKTIKGRDVLSTTSGWDLVVNAIADATSYANFGGGLVALPLADALKNQRLLLVLDNFELVISGAAFIVQLLTSCPGIKFLITTQELLSGRAEELRAREQEGLLRVLPLPLPSANEAANLETLSTIPSVELLTKRAKAVRPPFEIQPDTAADIVRVCEFTNGLPLVIEMVASVVATSRPRDVVQTLERQKWRTLPNAEKVEHALDLRYTSLTAVEQEVFRGLAMFSGGFTLDSATRVFEMAQRKTLPDIGVLGELVKKSLLRFEGDRYQMLWLLQDYGLQKLEAHEEASRLRREHAEYFRGLVKEGAPHLTSAERKEWFTALEAEYGNLRAVLLRSLRGDVDVQTGLGIAGNLFWFWNLKGHFGEGRQMLESFLRRPEAAEQSEDQARLLYGDGGLAFLQGDYLHARQQLTASARHWRAVSGQRGLAFALVVLAMVRRELDDQLDQARTEVEESVAIFRQLDDHWGLALALNDAGNILVGQRQYGEARTYYKESEQLWRGLNESWGLALTRSNLGHLAYLEKEYRSAEDYFNRAFYIQDEESDVWGMAWSFKGLGDVKTAQDEYAEAAMYYAQSFSMHWAIGRKQLISECLEGLAVVASKLSEWEATANLVGAAESLRTGRKPEHERDHIIEAERVAREKLGVRFERAWDEGQRWNAQELLANVESFAREWSSGHFQTLIEPSAAGSGEEGRFAPDQPAAAAGT
jgi:predicted ATPase